MGEEDTEEDEDENNYEGIWVEERKLGEHDCPTFVLTKREQERLH